MKEPWRSIAVVIAVAVAAVVILAITMLRGPSRRDPQHVTRKTCGRYAGGCVLHHRVRRSRVVLMPTSRRIFAGFFLHFRGTQREPGVGSIEAGVLLA